MILRMLRDYLFCLIRDQKIHKITSLKIRLYNQARITCSLKFHSRTSHERPKSALRLGLEQAKSFEYAGRPLLRKVFF